MNGKNLISLVCVLGLFVCTSYGTALYSTGFEVSEGYPANERLGYDATSIAMNWGKITNPVFVRSSASAFEGSQVAEIADGAYRCSYIDFNTNPSVANGEVWVDAYVYMTDTGTANNYVAFGLLDTGTTQEQASFRAVESGSFKAIVWDGDETLYLEAGTGFTLDQWWHLAIKVDYAADTISLYAKAVSAGDTSALTEQDQLTFDSGGSTVALGGSSTYASRAYISAKGDGALTQVDNLSVTVPEPATASLLFVGMVASLVKRRK